MLELLRNRGTLSLEAASGRLCYATKVEIRGILLVPYIAPVDRLDAITAAHALPISGHFGREKTYEKLRSQYYWKGMSYEVKEFVRSCPKCQMRKRLQPVRAGQLLLFSTTEPFQTVGIDIAGLFPISDAGNRYVILMVGRFTRWVEIAAVAVIDAITVADVFVEKIILRH